MGRIEGGIDEFGRICFELVAIRGSETGEAEPEVSRGEERGCPGCSG